jgi:hypothetical protein
MIPAGVQVYVASTPVDFRKGAMGLMAVVRDGGAAVRVPFEKGGSDQGGLVGRQRGVPVTLHLAAPAASFNPPKPHLQGNRRPKAKIWQTRILPKAQSVVREEP